VVQARWNGLIVADSNETVLTQGNHYFPPYAINWDLLEATSKTTICPWKGTAR